MLTKVTSADSGVPVKGEQKYLWTSYSVQDLCPVPDLQWTLSKGPITGSNIHSLNSFIR